MRRLIPALTICTVLVCGVVAQAAYVNVALNKPVSVTGAVYGSPASTITNGVFFSEGTHWQNGTVWWNGVSPEITVDLQGSYLLTDAVVQADNNDTYRLSYLDGNGLWQTWWDIGMAYGAGMRTRGWYDLADVVATKVRLQATGGDNMYSASEIQVSGGLAVPIPAAVWGGLSLLGMVAATKIRRTVA